MSLVKAIGIVAGSGYLLVIVAALCLPETKGKVLGTRRSCCMTWRPELRPEIATGDVVRPGCLLTAHENDCSRRRRDRRRHRLYLRQQGCEVTLLEREPDVALATSSFGNAGVIAPGYADAVGRAAACRQDSQVPVQPASHC